MTAPAVARATGIYCGTTAAEWRQLHRDYKDGRLKDGTGYRLVSSPFTGGAESWPVVEVASETPTVGARFGLGTGAVVCRRYVVMRPGPVVPVVALWEWRRGAGRVAVVTLSAAALVQSFRGNVAQWVGDSGIVAGVIPPAALTDGYPGVARALVGGGLAVDVGPFGLTDYGTAWGVMGRTAYRAAEWLAVHGGTWWAEWLAVRPPAVCDLSFPVVGLAPAAAVPGEVWPSALGPGPGGAE